MLLKHKLYSTLVSAIIIPLAISSFLFSNNIKSYIEEKSEKTDIPTALGEVRNAIELDILQPITISKSIAQNTFLHDWLKNGEPAQDRTKFINYLANINSNEQAIATFIVSAATTNYYSHKGLVRQVSKSDAWFYGFLNSDKDFELSFDIDKNTGLAAVFINYAINIDGERKAIAGIGRSLEAMTDLIKSYKVGNSGFVYLVDNNGVIKLHPDVELMGKKINLSAIKNNKINKIEEKGEKYLLSSTPLSSLDWHLVAQIPEQELYGAINNALRNNAIFAIAIALIGFLLAYVLSKQIFKPIEVISQAAISLTKDDGNLTARLPTKGNNEISELANNFNLFLDQIHSMFSQVSDSANSVKAISESVKTDMALVMSLSEQQSASTETVSAAVHEMEMTVLEISNSADNASKIAQGSQSETQKSNESISETIEQMGRLEHSMESTVTSVNELSNEIQSITIVLDVIKGISEQTNLLALNAAIEAARAGEQGRGFAVVADEVRNLAKKTADSTEEINSMITTLKSKASDTVSAINLGSVSTKQTSTRLADTGITLVSISESIINMTEVNAQMATATREQTSATSEISENITYIATTANETKTSIGQSSERCNDLNDQANLLHNLLRKFIL
jgi:methyl-accepting chemotaxis protein